ncbi:MAG: hypothetical protein QM715_03235 [Nibricoccus sp.]
MATPKVNAEERIHQLALICELDRLYLKLVLQPPPEPEPLIAGLSARAIGRALSVTQYFPGRIGQLARSMALGSSIFKIIKPLLSLRLAGKHDNHHEPNGKSASRQ